MRRFKNILILVVCLGLTASCDKPNVFEDFSSKDSDEALYIDAQKDIDNLDWDGAIDILENKLSSGFKARRDVINTRAGAYAGKCGIKFSTLVNSLKNASGSASNIFPFIMQIFSGVSVTPSACDQAITLMQSIGAVGVRTADENLFISVLGLARVATTLASKIDTNGDGSADAGTNVCDDWVAGVPLNPWTAADAPLDSWLPPLAQPPHFLTDGEVKKIAAGLGLITENLTALGDVIGGSNNLITAVDTINTACTGLGITCTATDPTAITAQVVYGFRILLDTSAQGFGTCDTSTSLPAAPPGSTPAPAAWYAGVCCPFHKF